MVVKQVTRANSSLAAAAAAVAASASSSKPPPAAKPSRAANPSAAAKSSGTAKTVPKSGRRRAGVLSHKTPSRLADKPLVINVETVCSID